MKNRIISPCVGDFITTNDKFSRKVEGSSVDLPDLTGFIVSKNNNKYGVRFGLGHKWTSNLNGLLSRDCGDELDESEFIVNNE